MFPWESTVERILAKVNDYCSEFEFVAFLFDLVVSLAYADALTAAPKLEFCNNCPEGFNAHAGFINLCAPCLMNASEFRFQRASKPQSAIIGRVSSEVLMQCLTLKYRGIGRIIRHGGTQEVDAEFITRDNQRVLCEIKAAPLLTYPMLFLVPFEGSHHSAAVATQSQLKGMQTAIYLHQSYLRCGNYGDALWPFSGFLQSLELPHTRELLMQGFIHWKEALKAYRENDKSSRQYYVTNACGKPPQSGRGNWPANESISDGKTSVGIDRTDDIKKGVYQTFKLAASRRKGDQPLVKTALLSNLPALRHQTNYIDPVAEVLCINESDFASLAGATILGEFSRRSFRPFDYLITLTESITRGVAF